MMHVYSHPLFRKYIYLVQLSVVLIFIAYTQFYKLSALPYRLWDETRLTHNAYEMAHADNVIVTHVHGQPDMWNTKPPLMIWAMAICIKLNGLNELSARMPAAICAALTILLVFFFVRRITQNNWAALLAAIILSTSQGYIGYHGSRYAEFDSMLTLFTTLYVISFFLYVEAQGPKRNSFLLLFFASLTLAVLTKSIAGLLFTPALFIYIIIRGQLLSTLSNKTFYIGALGFIVFVGGYYLLREHYNPGYLQAVADNELFGRFNAVNENHSGPWHYYWDEIRARGFSNWYWILPTLIAVVLLMSKSVERRASVFILLCAILFTVVISLSATKLAWYSLPAYPLMAILGGILFSTLSKLIAQLVPSLSRTAVILILIVVFSIQPVSQAYYHVKYLQDDLSADIAYAPSYYLRSAVRGEKNLNKVVLLFNEYMPQHSLYVLRLQDMGVDITEQLNLGKKPFRAGQKVLAFHTQSKLDIENNYNYQVLEEFYGVKLFLIESKK